MAILRFITHPDVEIDPLVPVPDWPLSSRGRQRMAVFARRPLSLNVGTIWCSTERKARDGADILAAAVGGVVREMAELGENDRSATGFLPPAEFEAVADIFFARPRESVRGWERAVDAQRRIVAAVRQVMEASPGAGDVAVVSHGGVGALLLCSLKQCEISRAEDQPAGGGGHHFSFDTARFALLHGWERIDSEAV